MAPRRPVRAYAALGRRVAAAREQARLSQPELARRAHVSVGYIGHIEVGRSRPSPEILRQLAAVLDIPYLDLFALAGYTAAPRPDETLAVRVSPVGVEETMTFSRLPLDLKRTLLTIADQITGTAARAWLPDLPTPAPARAEGQQDGEREVEQEGESDGAVMR